MRTGEMAGLMKTPVRARLGQHLQPQASYSKIGGRELEKDGSAVESVHRFYGEPARFMLGS